MVSLEVGKFCCVNTCKKTDGRLGGKGYQYKSLGSGFYVFAGPAEPHTFTVVQYLSYGSTANFRVGLHCKWSRNFAANDNI